jgi:hypothetical protein
VKDELCVSSGNARRRIRHCAGNARRRIRHSTGNARRRIRHSTENERRRIRHSAGNARRRIRHSTGNAGEESVTAPETHGEESTTALETHGEESVTAPETHGEESVTALETQEKNPSQHRKRTEKNPSQHRKRTEKNPSQHRKRTEKNPSQHWKRTEKNPSRSALSLPTDIHFYPVLPSTVPRLVRPLVLIWMYKGKQKLSYREIVRTNITIVNNAKVITKEMACQSYNMLSINNKTNGFVLFVHCLYKYGAGSNVVDTVTELRVGCRQGRRIFSSSKTFGPSLASFPDSCSIDTAGFSRRVWRPVCEADHSPPSSADFKNEWRYACTHPTCHYGVHRDNFTFHM